MARLLSCALAALLALPAAAAPQSVAGEPVPADLSGLEAEAEAGDAEAWYRLGLIREQGIGVPADLAAARAAYEQAAALGHAEAQFRLAQLLSQSAQADDLAAARRWYAAAAAQGLVAAAFNAAVFEENGIGGEVDLPAAAAHYEQAARDGIAAAARQLALLYYTGRLGVADPVTGLAWMLRAAELGLEEARSMAQDLADGMDAEQVAEAAALAETL